LKQEIARESSSGNAGLRVSRLPFSGIPHQSRLFIEYLRDPVSLKRFYPNAVGSTAEISSYAPIALENYRTDRSALCDSLAETNSRIGAGEKTFENIGLLRNPQTVAVVTGQQAGLFTGPLYTIYKALSAVKLAEDLNRKGTQAVPVFWTATEDHDFDEVSEAFFIDKSGALVKTKYVPGADIQDFPVGNIEIDAGIESVVDEIFDYLPQSEFSSDIRDLLSESWADGYRFGDAFARMLASVFRKFGLVFIDPMNDGIKRLSAPIYLSAIGKAEDMVSGVIARGRELVSEGFHTQVLVEDDYFPLFWHDDEGHRRVLRKSGDGTYHAKDAGRVFTIAELQELALREPRRFSPGVMLRPVVQDYLLPTVCYFGGGAEIAYFAQNSEVYRVLDRPVTPIFHRQSFTIVETKHSRVLEKFDLDLQRLFDGLEANRIKLAEDTISPRTARLYADVEEEINTELNRLDQAVSEIDPTLAANLVKRRRKIIYHIAALRKKTLLALARKDETVSRQIDNLFTALLPNGGLQERSLNVVTFLNKFGLNFIDWVYEAIDLEDKDHRIIEL
jgi:bacillithiol synthase